MPPTRTSLILAAALAACPVPALAQPARSGPVVVYLHGRIIEEQGPDAVSPEFGRYAYHAILDSLRSTGATVLAEVRPKGTDPEQYAAKVAGQVDSLVKAGVPPERITVVGFSKGGGIAMLASARLARTDVRFVFLAICSGDGGANLRVAGRILSVFERSDPVGQSCRSLLERALPGSVHDEHPIETGLKHGAFYRPIPEWLGPVRAWIAGSLDPGATDALLDRLVGSWTMTGTVQGEAVTYRMDAARTLQNRFIELHLIETSTPPAYEGRVFLGVDSATSRLIAHWLDAFGAGFSIPHAIGEARGDTLVFTFGYPSGPFRDTFAYHRRDDRWRFLLQSADSTGRWRLFADYDVRRRK
ncbi:MAG: hypothetical protein ACKVZ0_10650 [Gemmatimonadales bacterium]